MKRCNMRRNLHVSNLTREAQKTQESGRTSSFMVHFFRHLKILKSGSLHSALCIRRSSRSSLLTCRHGLVVWFSGRSGIGYRRTPGFCIGGQGNTAIFIYFQLFSIVFNVWATHVTKHYACHLKAWGGSVMSEGLVWGIAAKSSESLALSILNAVLIGLSTNKE